MGKLGTYTRRGFLGLGVLAAGGAAFGYYMYRKPYANPLEARLAEGEVTLNPYITIMPDNRITVITPRAEMGQGVHTTLASLVAEELDVSLNEIEIDHGPAASAYYNGAMLVEGGPFPFFDESFVARMGRGAMGVVGKFLALQITGGSSSTVDAFEKMREAGCLARLTLTAAAAERWNVDPDTLETAGKQVRNPANGESFTYGELAEEAAKLSPPSDMKLREPNEWKLLTRDIPRIEGREKVTGAPVFGIDVELPDMLYGAVRLSPRFGVGAKSHDPAPALAVSGVQKVIEIDTAVGKGFGVIADNTWAAFKGAEALDVVWEDGTYPRDTAGLWELYDAALDAEPSSTLREDGDAKAVIDSAIEVVTAQYSVPFLAHSTMEPMNATVQLNEGKLKVWTGTQGPGFVELLCARQLGMETEDVSCTTTLLGGGFGRRGEVDYAIIASTFAPHTDGKPVKVTWSREEDMAHDLYRPMARGRFQAVLKDGKIDAMTADTAVPHLAKALMGRYFPDLGGGGADKTAVDGIFDQPLDVPNIRVSGHEVEGQGVPISFWRSVGYSFNGYFHECFLDELAQKAGQDPLEFRLAHMTDPRFAPAVGVLEKVAQMSDWGSDLGENRAQGIAHTLSFGTWVAQVAQVAQTEDGIRIEKVWCAADPGTVLNPQIFRDQMMSGIIYGLSSITDQAITIADWGVEQSNFHDFDAMRMAQTPEIEVALLETSPKMGGAGEPGTPPSIPAVTNAIAKLMGRRFYTMPLGDQVDFA